jgi:hypothetical protein
MILSKKPRLRSKDGSVQVSGDVVHVSMLKPVSSDLKVAADIEENRSAFRVVRVVGEISLEIAK